MKELPKIHLKEDTAVDCQDRILDVQCEADAVTRETECIRSCALMKWGSFFDIYGTHLLVEVHLGGKLVVSIDTDSSDLSRAGGSSRSLQKSIEN